MIGLSPFMRGHQMTRTWLAVMGASVATYFVHDPLGFMAIDAIAAAIVMARPAGLPQKAIGALFTLMVLFDLGFYLSPQNGWDLFYGALSFVGWVQWAILAGWFGYDAWGHYRIWSDPKRGLPVAYKGRSR
jgi:hypothetical protein